MRHTILVVLAVVALGAVSLLARAEPDPVFRAALMAGPGCFSADSLHLRDALAKGSNWKNENILVLGVTTVNLLKKRHIAHLEQAGDEDISLFYLCDHGGGTADGANGDEPKNDSEKKKKDFKCDGECDETIGLLQESVKDDEFEGLFANVKGNKIFILDACFSGGLQDGKQDFRPKTQNAVTLWSAATNEKAKTLNPWTTTDAHAIFTGFLIAGLSDDGNGFARADANQDMMVTVKEWLDYAKAKTRGLNANQTPDLDDSREPAARKADKKVVFKYEKGKILAHPEGTLGGTQTDQCSRCTEGGCPELDFFAKSQARIGISTPIGAETVALGGLTAVDVDLPRIADTDSNGLEEVPTEMVRLELSGVSALLGPLTVRLRGLDSHPFRRSTGEIEEAANYTAGVLDLPPFTATGTARSFFDVFFEIELHDPPPFIPPGSAILHNGAPLRMEATLTHKPPAEGETYQSSEVIPLLDESNESTGVAVTATLHTPNPRLCDVNGDGTVDLADINAIFAARNTPATPGDLRDVDGDGVITVNDARICTLRCARPRCAP